MAARARGSRSVSGLLATLAAVACGATPDAPAATDASTTATASSGGSSGSDTGPCTVDDDCPGMLVCDAGACTGCTANDQCPGAQLCDDGVCVDLDSLPVCEQLAGSSCGNGVIEAIEECDGASACEACRATGEPTPWLQAEGLTRLVPRPDGGAYALGSESLDASVALRRYAPDASVAWSLPVVHAGFDVAVGATGDAYVVGTNAIDPVPSGAPWIGAWNADGAPLWSIEGEAAGGFFAVAADATRVVAGGLLGPTDQQYRGLLRQHGSDGALAWTLEDPTLYSIESVALVGTEVAATAWDSGVLAGDDVPKLLRVDGDGALRWSIDLPADGEPMGQRPKYVVGDGSGGTWSFGEAEGGPWAARHDTDGGELERLDCLGHGTGWIEQVAVGPQGQLALGVFAFTAPPSHGPAAAWIAIAQGGVISRALAFEGGSGTASTLAVAWRDDGALVAGWTEWFDVGWINRVVVLAP